MLKNNFILERGQYKLVAVMDESVSGDALRLDGMYIDLYDPELPVYQGIEIQPGTQRLLLDLSKVSLKKASVLAAASRAENVKAGLRSLSYIAKSPVSTVNVSRILLPKAPESLKVNGVDALDPDCWDEASHTYLLRFDNDPDGVSVEFTW